MEQKTVDDTDDLVSDLLPTPQDIKDIIEGTKDCSPKIQDTEHQLGILDSVADEETDLDKLEHEARKRDMEADFTLTRQNLQNIIVNGMQSIRDGITLANASDHPQVLSGLASLINAVTKVNKELLELHEARKRIAERSNTETLSDKTKGAHSHKKGDADTSTMIVHNNNQKAIFVGSTKELLENVRGSNRVISDEEI